MKKTEFSKRIVLLLFAVWLGGAVFVGTMTVCQIRQGQTVYFDGLLTYLGTPMSGGIMGYLIKSCIENRQKIARGDLSEQEPLIRPENEETV